MLPKNKPLRDRKYLASFRDASCYACGAKDGTVVAAHIRHGFYGAGVKPPDNLTLPLCSNCHAEQHRAGERVFWAELFRCGPHDYHAVEMAKDVAKKRYEKWRARQK